MNTLIARFKSYHEEYPYVAAAMLAAGFLVMLVDFRPFVYLGLVVTLVALIQFYPLSSRFTELLVFATLPVIGAIANFHSVCLTYNSVVLFLLCRSYAIHGRLQFRHVILYFLVIATWSVFYIEENAIIYGGGIMHGIMHPVHFILLASRWKWIRFGVFFIPVLWMLNNAFLYKQFFVAFWDFEILCVYLFWWLGKNKEIVVKRIFLISLPTNTFAQMYWDVCPRKGELLFLLKGMIENHFGPILQ